MTRPIVFGEVLFDHFPDHTVLGGAPFNVAWNLQGLGLRPLTISAIGTDASGDRVRNRMARWGMDTNGLQVSQNRPTGQVAVTIERGQPSYEIVPDQAYDFITTLPTVVTGELGALLYHGSLAWRSEVTRRTLRQWIDAQVPRFVDVNIRRPHYSDEWLDELLPGAAWVKVNDEELGAITETNVDSGDSVHSAVEILKRRYGDSVFFVTAGSKGAYCISGDQMIFHAAPQQPNLQDTVGAGDAFSAMTIEGICRRRSIPETMKRAVSLAARVCGINGATSEDRCLYEVEI